MNITVPKKDLLRLVSSASGIAERGKSTMPVLTMALLDAKDGRLVVSATDLYRSLVDSVPADVATPGLIAVPVAPLVDRLKALTDGPVSLIATDRSVVLKSVGAARKFTLPIIPGGDFPPIPRPDPNVAKLTIDAGILSRLIELTKFAVSTDESRPHLNSALIEWEGTVVRAVSTDGHRLSKAEATVEGVASASLLIPLKALSSIDDLADKAFRADGEEAGKLQIVPSGSSAFFLAGTATFSVKLVDAAFPPYAQVIPASTGDSLRANRTMLADAIRSVSIAASERTGGVKISIEKGRMILKSESPESGDGNDEIAVEYDGKKFSTGVNAKYMLDVFGALDSEEVTIGVLGELDPIVIRPVQTGGIECLFVIMPMRLS